MRGFAHFGYAPWFMYLIGVLELTGALALLRRGLATPAALLLAAVMVGAVVSPMRAGDALAMTLPATVLLTMLLGVAWARRGDLTRG